MQETESTAAPQERETNGLSLVVIKLLKGVLHEVDDPALWQRLLQLLPQVRDYVAVLGLELKVDESEGYAWLASRDEDDDDPALPRLMSRRPLSFPVSLLIALLRRKLAELDSRGGEARLILDREEIVNLMRTFLPESSNEARLVDRIDGHLTRVAELGFIRRLRDQPDKIEVRRILKAYVDAQWLNEFDARLRAYQAHVKPTDFDTGERGEEAD